MTRIQRHPDPIEGPVETTLDIMGGKWKGVILFRLGAGTRRLGAWRRLLCRITQRTLPDQLRQPEADGPVPRKVFPVAPPKVEYNLTERGRSLSGLRQGPHDRGMAHLIPPQVSMEKA